MPPISRSPRPSADVWLAAVDAQLGVIARAVGLLGASTPEDAHLERARLCSDFERGHERLPAWTYRRPDARAHQRLRDLDAILERLRDLEGVLTPLYVARVHDVRCELEAALAVGTPEFDRRARVRFPATAERARADRLADRWTRSTNDAVPRASGGPRLASDDRDPRSLVSRLRAEVARRRLPFTVTTSPGLSALAAISGDTIWVVEGRMLDPEDVERTVVHEIEAHALPRSRARSLSIGLFAIGTAGGSDDQEGYALWLEETRDVSTAARRRELGARHLAVVTMCEGGDFVAVVRQLRRLDVPVESALRIAERAFRGSHGATPGLGRERVYLEALLRVRSRLDARPVDEAVLGSGQVAVDAIDVLRPWALGG